MWFKNILCYDMLEPMPCNTDILMEKLAHKAIRPTHKTETESLGWVSPFGDDSDVFSHSVGGCHLLKACKEVRILPSTVIQETLLKKVNEIQAQEDRKVQRREKARLKDEIIFDLLPKAFTRRIYTYLYIDTISKKIIVDSSSRAVAENLLQLLRDTIGSFKMSLPEFDKTPSRLMTEWLTTFKLPSYIDIEDNCELMSSHNGEGIISCKRQDLSAIEIQQHLKSGKQVIKLGLTWHSRMSFILDQEFAIKRIQCLDLVTEARKENEAEDDAQRLDADFTLMIGEFRNLIKDLNNLLGAAEEKVPEEQITAKEEMLEEEYA